MANICSVEGCDKRRVGWGYCHTHYARFKRHGDPLKLVRPHNTPDGLTLKYSAEYKVWRGMKERCFQPKHKSYAKYGGRGITVCGRWKDSFENFLADMGPRPSPELTLDRENNDGNYEPGNCRWVDRIVQGNNRRMPNARMITFDGRTMSLPKWCALLGVPYHTIKYRLLHGWAFADAVTTGYQRQKKTT